MGVYVVVIVSFQQFANDSKNAGRTVIIFVCDGSEFVNGGSSRGFPSRWKIATSNALVQDHS